MAWSKHDGSSPLDYVEWIASGGIINGKGAEISILFRIGNVLWHG